MNEQNPIRSFLVKIYVSLGAMIVFCLIIAFLFYYVTGLPQYSLRQLVGAIKTHDIEKFNKYVDLDLIVDSLIASQNLYPFCPSLFIRLTSGVILKGSSSLVSIFSFAIVNYSLGSI